MGDEVANVVQVQAKHLVITTATSTTHRCRHMRPMGMPVVVVVMPVSTPGVRLTTTTDQCTEVRRLCRCTAGVAARATKRRASGGDGCPRGWLGHALGGSLHVVVETKLRQ